MRRQGQLRLELRPKPISKVDANLSLSCDQVRLRNATQALTPKLATGVAGNEIEIYQLIQDAMPLLDGTFMACGSTVSKGRVGNDGGPISMLTDKLPDDVGDVGVPLHGHCPL